MTAAVTWIELRMPSSNRLIAKYDPFRGLLQVRNRGEEETFDLAEISAQSAEGESQDEREN